MNKNVVFFILSFAACFTQVGCSVSSVGHNSTGPGLPTEIVEPTTPIENSAPPEPVIVSEPIDVMPSTGPSEQQPDEPTVMEPVVESQPPPDSYIEETPTNPAMIIVEGTPITNVEIEPETTEPSVAPEENEIPVVAETESEPVSTPQEIIDAVDSIDIQAPSEIADTETGDRSPASDYVEEELEQEPESPEVSDSDEDDVDFVVEGKCHGKKKATVLYNRKGKKKKGLTAECKKDRFKIKIREKKKHLKSMKVQTLLQ